MVAGSSVDVLVLTGPVSLSRSASLADEAASLRAAGLDVASMPVGEMELPRATLAVLFGCLDSDRLDPNLLQADRIVVRVGAGDNLRALVAMAATLEQRHARPVWLAPETPAVRHSLRRLVVGLACTAEDWPPPVDPLVGTARGAPARSRSPRRVDVRSVVSRSGPHELTDIGDDRCGTRPSLEDPVLLVVHGTPAPGDDLLPVALHVLARGGLVVAGAAWRRHLDGAALLAPAASLPAFAAGLGTDASAFARARRKVVATAVRRFAETDLVRRVCALSARCGEADVARPRPAASRAGLVVAGDFTRRDEVMLQALDEARCRHSRGEALLCLHLADPESPAGAVVHPGFDTLVADRAARVFDPIADVVTCDELLVLGSKAAILVLDRLRPQITARSTTLLLHGREASVPQSAARMRARLAGLVGAPCAIRHTGELAETCLDALRRGRASREGRAFRPAHASSAGHASDRPVLGCVVFDRDVAERTVRLLAEAGVMQVATLRLLPVARDPAPFAALRGPRVEVLDLDGFDLGRFVAGCDAICAPPLAAACEVAWSAMTTAALGRRPVLLEPGTAGPAWPATPLGSWPERLRELAPAARSAPRARVRPERVLFVTANGVGLGHLTRLAAIARHLPATVEPVFATMSQAVAVLHDLGFRAELLTSYAGHPADAWNVWLRHRLEAIVEAERPQVVVLDSSNPYPGVLRAVVQRQRTGLVWVRRGMWRADQDNERFLDHAGAFDLIVEPRDIAETQDHGATKRARRGVLPVPPISLLDEADLLPREAAREALGLDAQRLAVLVQLGSGTTRDLPVLLDRVFEATRRYPMLQVMHAEWLIAREELDLWPEVRRLRGYPIARYFRAFDFTITAAGYNSFHDVVRFGLPAIFIANDAPTMDDQGARAGFAQAAQAGFDLRVDTLDELEPCIEALLDARVRALLAANGRRLARANGASVAARAILGVAARAGGS